MLKFRSRLSAASAIAALLAPFPAVADMGLAPAKPGDVYISGEGGFLHQDGGDVNAYGIGPLAGITIDQNISADSGWFAGAMIGWEKGSPLVSFLPFTRVEIYGYGGKTDDKVSSGAPVTMGSADGEVVAIDGTSASASTERKIWEIGYRSEFDRVIDPTRTITWGLVSFIRGSDESSGAICSAGPCVVQRSSDVDTLMIGSMLIMEPEWRLTPGVALVGRLGAGYYTYDADGKFRSSSNGGGGADAFAAYVKDSDDGFGFRAAFGAGLKFILSPDTFLETFAEADYFSDVGTARFASSDPTSDIAPSRVTTDDMWELRIGGRLTVNLDNKD